MSHIVAVVPANPALETSTSAVAVVEFRDNWATLGQPKSDAIREVVAVRTFPVELSTAELVEAVAKDIAAPLGPYAKVVYSKANSRDSRMTWHGAYRRDKLAKRPMPVTITGEGLGTDLDGDFQVGEGELIQSLRELVKVRAAEVRLAAQEGRRPLAQVGFTLPPDSERIGPLIDSVMSIDPRATDGGRLKFPSRHRDGRAFALALALYRPFHPAHTGRRYDTARHGTFESFRVAHGAIGELARQ